VYLKDINQNLSYKLESLFLSERRIKLERWMEENRVGEDSIWTDNVTAKWTENRNIFILRCYVHLILKKNL
jgi:hypothetical protein